MDFSQEELIEVCDRLVAGLLDRAGAADPPVDALRVAEDHIGIPVEFAEPEEDERGRPRPRALLPDLLRKLDVPPGSESKQAAAHFRGLLAARVLVPTRMLRTALRHCKYDVRALKDVFTTAPFETVALRLLDLDAPCVIAVVDDGVVAVRRGNTAPAGRKLTPAEQACLDVVMEQELPHNTRVGGWTVHGWPVPNRPFRRVVLRAVPDDV